MEAFQFRIFPKFPALASHEKFLQSFQETFTGNFFYNGFLRLVVPCWDIKLKKCDMHAITIFRLLGNAQPANVPWVASPKAQIARLSFDKNQLESQFLRAIFYSWADTFCCTKCTIFTLCRLSFLCAFDSVWHTPSKLQFQSPGRHPIKRHASTAYDSLYATNAASAARTCGGQVRQLVKLRSF